MTAGPQGGMCHFLLLVANIVPLAYTLECLCILFCFVFMFWVELLFFFPLFVYFCSDPVSL